MINFKLEAAILKEEIIEVRRKLHSIPELGFQEFETSKFIKMFLKDNNIEFLEFAKTGICGIIKGNLQGDKVVALRSDMDALPIVEKNNLTYKSQNKGTMHACGHDAHMAILLITAKILNKNKENFKGIIKIIFEPAEETIGGAKVMIDQGVLENPKVDIMLGLHVDETVKSGQIMIKNNHVNASSNPFNLIIKGYGGHGAYPYLSVDPIIIASNIILTAQTIISREIPATSCAVITFASIHGGSACNVIPSEVEISGIIRTVGNREFIIKRFTEIINGISKSMRGSCSINIEDGYPSLINNSEVVNLVRVSAADIIRPENVLEQDKVKMGVESFAYFANEVPSAFYFLGTRNEQKGIVHPAHNENFNIDEDALINGVAIQCLSVFNYLTK